VEIPRKLFIAFCLITLLALLKVVAVESDDVGVIQAKDIIEKVKLGEPINYSHVLIKGDLNLSASDAFRMGTIASPINITDSILLGPVDFDHMVFQEMINFEGTRFIGPVSFIGAQFNKYAKFEKTHFEGYSSFIDSEFIGSVSFIEAQFSKDAKFEKSHFEGYSYFMDSEFNVSAHFSYTRFNNSTNFFKAEFRGISDFYISRFNENAIFTSVVFEDDSNFEEALFANYASFREAKFGNANFKGVQFRGFVDFDSSQFTKSADFIGAKFNKLLYFRGISFTKMSIIWDSIKEKLVCDGPTYLLLIKNFKDMEKFEDADKCYYQYRDIKRKERPFDWEKVLDYVSWLSCGFGVRWQHTILSSIVVAILFGIYYELSSIIKESLFIKGGLNNYNYNSMQNLKKSIHFSALILLSLAPEWSKFGREEYAKFLTRHWYSSILERLIGWGLMLLLIGTLSRLMVRY
jgi:uncharacterized protein YjbI with pentapeptide repeats